MTRPPAKKKHHRSLATAWLLATLSVSLYCLALPLDSASAQEAYGNGNGTGVDNEATPAEPDTLEPAEPDTPEPAEADVPEDDTPRIGEELVPTEPGDFDIGEGMVESPDEEPPPTEASQEEEESEELYVHGEEAFVALMLLALLGFVVIRICLARKTEASAGDNVNDKGGARAPSPGPVSKSSSAHAAQMDTTSQTSPQ